MWFLIWAAGILGAAEFAARGVLRYRKRYRVHIPGRKTVLELDADLSRHLERHVRIEVNSRGERGDELPGHTRTTLQIAVLGGSAAECYFLDQPASWPERVAAYMREWQVPRKLGCDAIHVGNLSQAELTSSGARRIVQRVLLTREHLDAVLLMVGVSDMLRWLRSGAPQTIPTQTAADVFNVHPEGPFSWRPRALGLAEVGRRVRTRWSTWRTPVINRRNAGASVLRMRIAKQNAARLITEVPNPEGMLAAYRRNLTSIIHDLRTRPLAILVLGQPHFDSRVSTPSEAAQFWNGGVGNPLDGPITTFYADSVLDELAWQVNTTAESVAADLGVSFVNLGPVVPNDLVHYYDQFHFTPAGADAVARVVAHRLAELLVGSEHRFNVQK